MKNKRIQSLLVVLIALGLIVAGCGGAGGGDKKPAVDNKTPIKIGFFAPVTGPAAADGDSVTKAASTMITEIVLGYIAIILLITILRIAGKAFDIPIENPRTFCFGIVPDLTNATFVAKRSIRNNARVVDRRVIRNDRSCCS